MPREHEGRSGKVPARKKTPDKPEKLSKPAGSADIGDLSRRAERQNFTPRGTPDSVRSKIKRRNEQARHFNDHAAKPNSTATQTIGVQQTDFTRADNTPAVLTDSTYEISRTDNADQPVTRNDGDMAVIHQAQIIPTDRNGETVQDSRRILVNQKRFSKLRSDKPDSPPLKGTPEVEQTRDTEQPPIQEALPDGQSPTGNTTALSHEHTPRSAQNRPGKLRYGEAAIIPQKLTRRKPVSPNAAKYIPPAETKAEITDGNTRPVTEPSEGSAFAPNNGSERANHSSEHGSARSFADKPDKLHFTEDKSADVQPPIPNPSGKVKNDDIINPADLGAAHIPSAAENPENTGTSDVAEGEPTSLAEPISGANDAPVSADSAPDGGTQKRADKPVKLKFTEGETAPAINTKSEAKPPGKKLTKARSKAERSAKKLDKARSNLPKKRRVSLERTFDEKSGKPKQKLRFDGEVKSMGEHIKGPIVTRPIKAGANMAVVHAHKKLYQVEHENVGTQAAHKGTMIAESGIRMAYRHHKTAPYRKVQKLESRTARLNIKASYQQALNDNPQLRSNAVSRMAQKRKIKKQYAKAAREAQRTGKNVEKAAVTAGKIAGKVVDAVKRHPVVLIIIGILFLLIILISSIFTAFSGIASSAGSSISSTVYLAEDADIDGAELLYTEWESDLRLQIQNAESDYPGYNEYRYYIDSIGHDPRELMAFLTAVYGEFHYADIEDVLRQIFDEQYQLSFTPSIEIRYADPTDANDDNDYEPYGWNVMTVTLTSRSFYDAASALMSDEQRQQYGLLTMSGGNRQYAESPFAFNWLPYITSGYGYRIHPITGARDYHKGVDIAVPAGTEIHSAHDGTVTFAGWHDSYGYYAVVDDGNGLVTKYAHCESLLVSTGHAVSAGDIIAKVGSTGDSTGPHLHYELIRDGTYLNPVYFSK